MKNALSKWGFSFLLSLPILVFLLCYFFNHAPGLMPTGFIQYDNVAYAGNAQQYLDPNHSGIFYQNRLNDSGNYPNIYFQPQHLILALLMKAGLSPGIAFCLFTYILSIVFFRILIGLYDSFYPQLKYRRLMIVLFSWGGGMITLAGWLLYLLNNSNGRNVIYSGVLLDPADGWWGLNLGRSVFFSLEVFYHLLFFAGICLIVKKKWIAAAIVSALLSISHPFTGLEYLLIITFYLAIEKLILRNKNIPWLFIVSIVSILGFHLWYYLFYLNRFAEHASVFTQYQLNWRLRFFQFIPAYILVGIFSYFTIKRSSPIRRFLQNENTRLIICWAFVAFLLANHELFIKPMQPLHFTRGYIWSALFLLGATGLHFFIEKIKSKKYGSFILSALILLLLFDNIYWITINSRYSTKKNPATLIDNEQNNILKILQSYSNNNTLIVSSDESLPYLATIYTNAWSWISHKYNTPFYDRKRREYDNYIHNNIMPAAWANRELLFIADKHKPAEIERFKSSVNTQKILESGNYIVYSFRK